MCGWLLKSRPAVFSKRTRQTLGKVFPCASCGALLLDSILDSILDGHRRRGALLLDRNLDGLRRKPCRLTTFDEPRLFSSRLLVGLIPPLDEAGSVLPNNPHTRYLPKGWGCDVHPRPHCVIRPGVVWVFEIAYIDLSELTRLVQGKIAAMV